MVRTWRGCEEMRPTTAGHRWIDVQGREERRAAHQAIRWSERSERRSDGGPGGAPSVAREPLPADRVRADQPAEPRAARLVVGPPLGLDEPDRPTPVHVAVYDTYGSTDLEGDVRLLCGRTDVDHVIVLAAETDPSLVTAALAAGADAVVSKFQPSTDLFASIIAAGGRG